MGRILQAIPRNLRRGVLVLTALLGVALAGCQGPRVAREQDPEVKIPWMKRAAREKNIAAMEKLVGGLDDDDAAVRMYAIAALKDLTGETMGYRCYDPESQRTAAVARWKEWLEKQGEKP